MSEIKAGDLVMVISPIWSDFVCLPLGAVGEVIFVDMDTDCDVVFNKHPCPAGPDTSWICAQWQIIKIDPPAEGDSLPTRKDLEQPA